MHPQEFLTATQDYRRAFQEVEAQTEKVGLSPGQWLVLVIVAQHPTGMSTLSDMLVVSRPGATRLIGELTRKRLVRVREDAHDGRSRIVWITAKGKRALEQSKQGGKGE
jgi:DNA-binding MarR family transcriptional regulator